MSRIKIVFGIIICLTVLTVNVAAERPTVIITFDDGWRSVSDKAYPIMQANDQKGVSFVYVLPIIGGYPDFMQQDRLNILYEAGWDISSHTYSHVNLTSVNSTTLYYEFSESYDWLNTNGYPRSAMFLAYPEGSYNAAVIEAVRANHYLAARTVDSPDADYSNYNLASPNIYMLKAYETLGGIDNDSTVIDQINNTITTNGLLILAFHKIVDNLSADPSNALTEFKTSDFQNVSNYLQSRSSDVDVRTLSDYFGAEPLPRYMPPTPINTTVNGSKILTWTAGVGNGTDYFNYNVNGAWYNESNTTFYNVTGLSPSTYTVKVYAVNSTNGRTVNSIPATLNSIISVTSTPTSTSSPEVVSSSGSSSSGISSSGSSSSGSSIGGGGVSSGENHTNIEVIEKNDLRISKDVNTSYRFTHAKNPIMFVNITGNTSLGIITASIEVLKNTSTLVKTASEGLVYKNANIWVGTSGDATPKNIKQALVKFRVDNAWMSANNVAGSDIVLVKWDRSAWMKLETYETTKDNTYTYYEAKTQTFSSFAIIGLKGEKSEPIAVVVTETPANSTSIPTTVPTKGMPGFEIVTAIAVIYMLCRKKK